MKNSISILIFITFLSYQLAFAQENTTKSRMDTISIYDEDLILPEELNEGYTIDKTVIESSKTGDVHQVLKTVPGVFVQEEEGHGHRPNIGLRGTHPHRSKKITLMEDGILIAPAPYSAPAAYYFPIMDNLNSIEVFKGPRSTKYGPNSIGGSLDLKTRSYFEDKNVSGKFNLGSYNEKKADVAYGDTLKGWSWLLHSTYNESDGFKKLDNENDTGFSKTSVGLKVKKNLDGTGDKSLEARFQYSGEVSHESYLGISSDDFAKDPLQRYSASQNDLFTTNHRQYQLKYSQAINDSSFYSLTAYNHQFERLWSKFESFSDGTSPSAVLTNPKGTYTEYFDILKGRQNSAGGQNLVLGNNDRRYISQGLQLDSSIGLPISKNISFQSIDWGFRFHYDEIVRKQTKDEFSMTDGSLVKTSTPRSLDLHGQNKDQSFSQSVYSTYNLNFHNFETATTLRYDYVQSEHLNHINRIKVKNFENLFTPGFQLAYNLSKFQTFAGINRGLNLVGPGQESQVKPEESLNYELGLRKKEKSYYYELVGFVSEYSNIVSVCTFSSGCSSDLVDKKFNGGKANIYGAELSGGMKPYLDSLALPIHASITFTSAKFSNEFESGSNEWGLGMIQKGDPLPYIPEFQAQFSIGLQKNKWLIENTIKYQSKSYDQAIAIGRKTISPYGVVDLKGEYNWDKSLSTFIKVNNILNNEYVVSYRPFGARPGQPLTVIAGVSMDL